MTQSEPVFSPPPETIAFVPDPRATLPRTAEVIVIGGGMLGASAAYHLARAGMRPLVIEANSPASGASGRNVGMALAGLGGHFPRVTRIVQEAGGRSILDYTTRSLDMIEAWDAELPGGMEWDRFGSLDLALDEAEERQIRHMASIQAAEGLEVRVVDDATELRSLAGGLAVDEVRAAKWTPRDAKLNPFRLCYALLEATRALGGTVVTGVRVDRLLASGGRVAGVSTSHGEVAAGAVLLATNAWTPALAPHLAANLTPIRETVCVTEMVTTSIGAPGFETTQGNEYWRQMRTGEVLIGGYAVADEAMGGSYSTRVRPLVAPRLATLLARLHPALRDARIIRCWAGLLDFASLEIPMAGPLPAEGGTPLPGAFVGAGLTGHGHPYAPVLGLLLAELIASGEARTLPLAPFDPARYVGVTHPPTWLEPFRGVVTPIQR
jgi:glycine/D-amino acid oxidase-like deaminating enzyme